MNKSYFCWPFFLSQIDVKMRRKNAIDDAIQYLWFTEMYFYGFFQTAELLTVIPLILYIFLKNYI